MSARKPNVRSHPRAPSVGFVSVGCPKALVDSERLITELKLRGYDIAPGYAGADLVVVGNRGMMGARRFITGSVPNRVAHHCPCHLLVVHTT